MKMIIVLAMLAVLFGSALAQPTPPATPPSPASMGIQAPPPTSSTQAPPVGESSQTLVSTTQAFAMAAAPSTMATATTPSTYMIAPPGTSVPNKFYIPYYPSTVASCYFNQWIPMYLDIQGYGPLYTYEWYPNGRLASQYMANVPYPSWKKIWFYGDATGWHTLQYYCNGWSNYIYVYVHGRTTAPSKPTPPPVYPTPPPHPENPTQLPSGPMPTLY